MLDRVQLILKSKNLSASKFADEIGVQRSAISHIISGRNKPSLEFIMKLLSRFPEIRTEWLLYGTGAMYKELNLFDNEILPANKADVNLMPENINEIIEEPEPINKPIDYQDEPEEMPETENAVKTIQSLDNKAIEKIIVFYSDKTFSIYKPEN